MPKARRKGPTAALLETAQADRLIIEQDAHAETQRLLGVAEAKLDVHIQRHAATLDRLTECERDCADTKWKLATRDAEIRTWRDLTASIVARCAEEAMGATRRSKADADLCR